MTGYAGENIMAPILINRRDILSLKYRNNVEAHVHEKWVEVCVFNTSYDYGSDLYTYNKKIVKYALKNIRLYKY